MSCMFVSLIVIADIAVIFGALAYICYDLPGYDRLLYMKGISIKTQRRLRMETFLKSLIIGTIIIFGSLMVLFIYSGITIDQSSIEQTTLPSSAQFIEMQDGKVFLIVTKKNIWLYEVAEHEDNIIPKNILRRKSSGKEKLWTADSVSFVTERAKNKLDDYAYENKLLIIISWKEKKDQVYSLGLPIFSLE